jgi:hypothetical protein
MGGHGTWNVGVHTPGRFATIAASHSFPFPEDMRK